MNNGWIKLHRQLFESSLWLEEPFTKSQAWIDLFANANHKDNSFWVRGIEIPVKRGQIGWSEVTMAKRWKWSRGKVRRFLFYLETKQQIVQQKIDKITSIITIINYNKYQNDTSKETTDGQQTDNRRYTNKNDKNVKNEKNTSKGKPLREFNPLGAEIIKAFEEVDPKNKTYYGNTTQRTACDFLLDEYGLEEVKKRIAVLPQTNRLSYFPTITTPVQLRDKWVQLQDAVAKKREEVKAKKPLIVW